MKLLESATFLLSLGTVAFAVMAASLGVWYVFGRPRAAWPYWFALAAAAAALLLREGGELVGGWLQSIGSDGFAEPWLTTDLILRLKWRVYSLAAAVGISVLLIFAKSE